jgi:hypothetical protein
LHRLFVREDAVACGGKTFNTKKVPAWSPTAPAYAGNGIHYVAMAVMHQYSDPEHHEVKLPTDWEARWLFAPVPQRFTQLLVCDYQDTHYKHQKVRNCRYDDGNGNSSTANSMSARYQFRLLEARTGRTITTFSLVGTEDTCPGSVIHGVDDFEYDQIVSDAALAAKLRPYVVGPARH